MFLCCSSQLCRRWHITSLSHGTVLAWTSVKGAWLQGMSAKVHSMHLLVLNTIAEFHLL